MADIKLSAEDPSKTKRHHVTREDEADRCLNHTVYSKGSQILIGLIFLAVVFGVPIAQHIVEIRANLAKRAAWDPNSGEPKPGIAPHIYDVVSLLPSKKDIESAKGFWGYWSLIPSAESISDFETSLKTSSVLTQALLSPAQNVLTKDFGVGNEKAYCGREGWLFYRPDVEYLTTDGFLTPGHERAESHAFDFQPDPIKAILDFKRQLDARHITLVVMPMSTKPMIHPEMLVGPSADGAILQNSSFTEFVAALESNGVQVYDPTPGLLKRKQETGTKQFLETDTHWAPDAMEAVAGDLSLFIKSRDGLPPVADPGYRIQDEPISNLGDIAEMLKLPADQTIYKPQSVTVHEVLQSSGSPWEPERTGDVLLLGDSFSNIFSLKGLNWGVAGGFAEQLSYRLGRPVDKFVINAGGAFKSRQALAQAMHVGDRLAGKHVVVWEFSMRDLAQGDWKMITLPTPPKAIEPVVPPQPVGPVPPVALTPLKVVSVMPSTIDTTKSQAVEIQLMVPKGTWLGTIAGADGTTVAKLVGGVAADDGPASTKWDGKTADGKPVTPGAYKVTISGTRPDGKAIDPVTTSIVVTGPPTGKIEPLGANPDTIDSIAKVKTKIAFKAPTAGRYAAVVLDAKGKTVRKLSRQTTTDGSLTFEWNGQDAADKPAADGQYKVRVSADDKTSKLEPVETAITVKSKKPTPPPPVVPGRPTGGGTGQTTPPPTVKDESLVVTGTIVDRAKTPAPGSVPYKDALIQIQLTGIHVASGKLGSGDIAVYVWGMRNNKLVDGAIQKGGTITLKLTPWDKASSAVTSLNQISLDSDAVLSLPLFFGEIK
jgi:alginate O-acetyltransferase complex protein AlgJ